MNFDWNLPSEDDDEDEQDTFQQWDSWIQKRQQHEQDLERGDEIVPESYQDQFDFDAFAPPNTSTTRTRTKRSEQSTVSIPGNSNEDEVHDEFDKDEDGIDWEDAEEAQNDAQAQGPTAFVDGTHSTTTSSALHRLRPVTIDLNQKVADKEKNDSKLRLRKQRRHKYRVETLPYELQALLWNLHQAHLLTLTSRAVWLSRLSCHSVIMAVAHSLLPPTWFITTIDNPQPTPTGSETATAASTWFSSSHNNCLTLSQLQEIFTWYCDLIYETPIRRSRQQQANWAAGAPRRRTARRSNTRQSSNDADNNRTDSTASLLPAAILASSERQGSDAVHRLLRLASYLSPTSNNDPQLLQLQQQQQQQQQHPPVDKDHMMVQLLFLALVRSMACRARYVQAMDPMSPDLHVDHPLLLITNTPSSSNKDLFRAVFQQHQQQKQSPKPNGKRKQVHNHSTLHDVKAVGSRKSPQSIETSASIPNSVVSSLSVGWIEVLCRVPNNDNGRHCETKQRVKKQVTRTMNEDSDMDWSYRWIHVDPVRQHCHQPTRVEAVLSRPIGIDTTDRVNHEISRTPTCSIRRKRQRKTSASSLPSPPATMCDLLRGSLAFVVAVEHIAEKAIMMDDEEEEEGGDVDLEVMENFNCRLVPFRLTDVTPRYASSWIDALRKRGVLRGKKRAATSTQASSESPMESGIWWKETLETINSFDGSSASREKQSKKGTMPTSSSKSPTSVIPPSGLSQDDAILLHHSDCEELDQPGNDDEDSTNSSNDDDEDDDDNDRKLPAMKRTKLQNDVDERKVHDHAAIEDQEQLELQESANQEAIPTSKVAFKTHPMYVIPSALGVAEVLSPDASKNICGVYKGELVYRRTASVSVALPANKWPYQGRKVLDSELDKPIKRIKARKKATTKGFKALKTYGISSQDSVMDQRIRDMKMANEPLQDGMQDLYAVWQTEPWSPSVVEPTDEIPVNEYKNIELALLNPGLVHIDERGAATVAKKLAIPYAPCLVGFEGHGSNRTPTIRGIVVHRHNKELIQEAYRQVVGHAAATERENRRHTILLRWKKLMVGLLTKERIEREYG